MSLKYQDDVDADQREPIKTRPGLPWLTFVLIASYTVVFVAQISTDLDTSILLAGDDKDRFVQNHEYWRMLTGAALHGSILHYAMNSYAFYSFGRVFEVLKNRWRLPVVFLLAAVCGSIFSFITNPHGISIGASGGIVGIVGYLAVYSFKRRDFITPEFRRSLIFNIAFILFYGFVLVKAVDNFAHIGGLIAGAAYAAVEVPSDAFVDPTAVSNTTEIAGLASIAVYAATCIFATLIILKFI